MRARQYLLSILSTLFLVVLVQGQGCQKSGSEGGGTTTGNPFVSLRMSGYTASSKPQETAERLSTQSTTTTVQDVKMCFKRLRIRVTATGADEQDYDLQLGEVTLSPTGTNLTTVLLPKGIYERVEFDLDSDCASGKSLSVINGNGSFSTSDNLTIRFDGQVSVASDQDLTLLIHQIVAQLDQVTNSSQLKSRAEAASGSF